jgi:CheY-like chemotaxis protein
MTDDNKLQILVVDDDPDFYKLLFLKSNWVPIWATSEKEALEHLTIHQHSIDAIFLDLFLEEGSSFEQGLSFSCFRHFFYQNSQLIKYQLFM